MHRRSNVVPKGLARGLAAAISVLLSSPACHRPSAPPRPNVLLVTIDTLRADRLGVYGHLGAETPRLDALASEGVRFETVVAPAPLTLPSHASLLTSMWPRDHGLRDNAAFEMSPDARLLSEVLHDAGYATAAFVGAYVLHSRFGLARGFDVYDDAFHYVDVGDTIVERRGDEVVRSARAWLEGRGEAPFFAWVHLYDPHDPYDPPEPYKSRFAGRLYDGEVAYTDALVGQLLDAVSDEDTLVVVTADHGEGLDDHGEPTHGLFVYDTTLLVPLLMRLPRGELAGVTVASQVRLVDVAPTILDVLGSTPPDAFEGQSLLPLARGERTDPLPAYSESLTPRLYFGWSELHALRRDGYKLISAPRPELYHVAKDPGETQNLFDEAPERARAMLAQLEGFAAGAKTPRSTGLSAADQRALLSLGYLGGVSAPEGTDLADPKDKVSLYRRYNLGNSLLIDGRAVEAERELAAVVAEDPAMAVAWFALGNARFAQSNYRGAVEALRAALERSPDYAPAQLSLGAAELGVGDRAAARATFEAVLSQSPSDPAAHLQLGEMELEEERPRRALAHFDRALEGHEETPSAHLMRGVALFQLGELAEASASLDRALALDPDLPRVHFYRALLAESRGDGPRAIEEYRSEVEAHPDDFESWFNLSLKLGEIGDLEGAIAALRETVAARPDLAAAHLYLARALLATNDPERLGEAETSARRGLALAPPPDLRALGEETLAEIRRRR